MSHNELSRQELFELWFAIHDDSATPAQIDEINRLITENADVRSRLLKLSRQQSWLMWHGSTAVEPDNLDAMLARVQSAMEPPGATPVLPIITSPPTHSQHEDTILMQSGAASPLAMFASVRNIFLRGTGAMTRAAAALLLATGVLIGALAVAAVPTRHGAEMPQTDGVVALMTSFEGSRWSDANGFSPDRNSLLAGQQLDLTTGSAQSTFGYGATIVVQGPASFSPLSKKAVALREGKLTVDSPRAAHGFTVKTPLMEAVDLETPFGNRTKFSLDVSDRETSLHVFQGEVCVWFHDALNNSLHASGTGIRVSAGEGLTLDAASAMVKQIPSDPAVFMPSPSEKESDLVISSEYVSAIKTSKPIAYWRFEQATGNAFVNNEMPTLLPLRICGDAKIESPHGNGRAVLPHSDRESWLKADDALKAFAGDYALEMWMKASAYHEGVLVNLTQKRSDGQAVKSAGLIELVGADHLTFLPGSIRYLHREPAGVSGGTNALSTVRYVPNQWHHVVATKSDSRLSLFIDGKLVGAESDSKRLTTDPQIVIGRLHAESDFLPTRPFVGQIDEVAIYDHFLKSEEVENHFKLGGMRE